MSDPLRPTPSRWLFVSWIDYHTRSESLAQCLECDTLFLSRGVRHYPGNLVKTMMAIRRAKPAGIIVMQPPAVAMIVPLVYGALLRVPVVADLHTGSFLDPKWRWSLDSILRLCRRRGAAIVTNEQLAQIARKQRVRVFVVDDPIPTAAAPHPSADHSNGAPCTGPTVLVPVAYARDEPIDEILRAARELPDVEFVFTGRAPAEVVAEAPPNVVFPGYLPVEAYRHLLARASVVLALTTEESTMQCAGYEALTYGRPLVTSPTRVLRQYYGDAAHYAEPDAASIAQTVRVCLGDPNGSTGRMVTLRDTKQSTQVAQLRPLRSWMRATGRRRDRASRIGRSHGDRS